MQALGFALYDMYFNEVFLEKMIFQSLIAAVTSAVATSTAQHIGLSVVVASQTDDTEYPCVIKDGDPWPLVILPLAVFIMLWCSILGMNLTILFKIWFLNRAARQTEILHQGGNSVSAAISRRDRQVTRLLLLVTMTFTILTIPDVVIIVSMAGGESVRKFWIQHSSIYEKCQATMNVMGCSFTFLFYTVTGRNFRDQIRAFLRTVFTRGNQE